MKELQVKCQAVAVGKGIFEMQGIKILITRLSISRAKKINKLNSQTDFKEVSSFCKNGIVLLCQREWAVFHAFIFNMQTKECILHTASSSEALYMEETAYMFLFHWEVTVYSEHLTEIFLTCRTFFFLPPVSIKVDIYFGLFQEVLRRQRGSCSFCIIAGTPWNCTYWQLE